MKILDVNVENMTGLTRKITVSVEGISVDEGEKKILNKLNETRKIPGFRPGKVPLSVLKDRYGSSAREEAAYEVIKNTFVEALKTKDIEFAGTPKVESFKADKGEPLVYVVVGEIYPPFEINDLSNLQIEKTMIDIKDEDVENVLQRIRKQHAEWDEVERIAQLEDRLIVDIEGTVEGKPIPGGVLKDTSLVLGAKTFIPGFEEGLLGAAKGEQRQLDITFPNHYRAADLAGKPAKFEVTVKSIAQPRLPEVDEAFAKKMGIENGDLSALNEQVRKHMEYELKRVQGARLKSQVFEKLLAANKIEIPESLRSKELELLHEQLHEQQGKMGGSSSTHHDHDHHAHPELLPIAEKRVGLALLIGEIIKKYQVKLDPTRVRQYVEALAKTYDNPEQVINWYYSDKKHLGEIESTVLEDQVIDKILEHAKIEEKKASYTTVMLEEGETEHK